MTTQPPDNLSNGNGVSDQSPFTRPGDPDEFGEELTGDVEEPDDPGRLDVPPGLVRRLLADPVHAPEILASHAVEQFADRAARDVRLLRERNPDVTDRQLAVYFKRKYSRAARWEGAGTGTAGLLGLPVDLVALAWIQNRLVLSIAAAYGHDMTDHRERAVEVLMIQGIHNSREVARKGLVKASEDVLKKLILRHLRKEALTLAKQMFRVVGITFTRKALLEKGVPLVSVPISAGVNDVSTRLLGNQAIKFYDTTIE
ncbi:MAG: EcsC family protein [Actinomycetota bacterium]|nr:EcsC family protein [Actinomycetota bacterium]